jgi:transposase-like protein
MRFIEARGTPGVKMEEMGYPSMVRFAQSIGVTPRTLRNWRKDHKEFEEACDIADEIQDEVLNEMGLFGDADGRVAMKIRELKLNAKKIGDDVVGGGFKIEIKNFSEQQIELKEYEETVNEDTGYIEGS